MLDKKPVKSQLPGASEGESKGAQRRELRGVPVQLQVDGDGELLEIGLQTGYPTAARTGEGAESTERERGKV